LGILLLKPIHFPWDGSDYKKTYFSSAGVAGNFRQNDHKITAWQQKDAFADIFKFIEDYNNS